MDSSTEPSLPQEESLTFIVLKVASLLLVILVGIYGNVRVIYTVLVADVIPVLNLLVASLSIADLATCIIIMPLAFISLVYGDWIFGQIVCTIHGMLLVFLCHVAALSTVAIVYERYQAIYRKRFPSLSHRQVTTILCMVWTLPLVFVAPMLRQNLTYSHTAGVCFDSYEGSKHWDIVFLVRSVINGSVAISFVLFAFWKLLAFLLPLRRRVSPGTFSNSEKFTLAAHVHSTWTTIMLALTYMILVIPLHIFRFVRVHRRSTGKSEVADNVSTAFLWLYWLQYAVKPVIYVARSDRLTCCFCRCSIEVGNRETWNCFRERNRARAYEVSEDSLKNNQSGVSGVRDAKLAALPSGEFIELSQIATYQPHASPPLESSCQRRKDRIFNGDVIDHPEIIIEDLTMESYMNEVQQHTTGSENDLHDGYPCNSDTVKPADVSVDVAELESIERMFDDALRNQQSEWDNNLADS